MKEESRIEKRIEELKLLMWDRFPPEYLPLGRMLIETDIRDYPEIEFNIEEKTTDFLDSTGNFGIRKNKDNEKWEIYSVSTREVIKETTKYSSFFNARDWDPGTSELSSNSFRISKEVPIKLREKNDGTVMTVKDIFYKIPQISEIEWSQIEQSRGNFSVSLDFRLRSDVKIVRFQFTVNDVIYSNGLNPVEETEGRRDSVKYNVKFIGSDREEIQFASREKISVLLLTVSNSRGSEKELLDDLEPKGESSDVGSLKLDNKDSSILNTLITKTVLDYQVE
jgi:hypothetical protein